jgi:hypothetical protein
LSAFTFTFIFIILLLRSNIAVFLYSVQSPTFKNYILNLVSYVWTTVDPTEQHALYCHLSVAIWRIVRRFLTRCQGITSIVDTWQCLYMKLYDHSLNYLLYRHTCCIQFFWYPAEVKDAWIDTSNLP